MTALASLDEWTRGVLFPLVVIVVAACAGWSVRCLTNIMREFQDTRRLAQETRRELRRIAHALERAGILVPPDD